MLKRTAVVGFRIAVGAAILTVLCIKICLAPSGLYSEMRLYNSYLLQRGLSLYDIGTGPIFLSIYPPLAAVAYLPVTWIRESIPAVIAGSFLTALYYFLPTVLIIRSIAKRPAAMLLLFAAFLSVTYFIIPLQMVAFDIHCDAPSLMLCALACFVMQRKPSDASFKTYFAAAFLAALAVWTKQTSVPVFAALAVYAALTGGRRRLGVFAAAAFTASLLVTALMLVCFAPRPLFEGIWTMPHLQPLDISPWFLSLMLSCKQMCITGAGIATVVGVFLVFKRERHFYRSEGSVYLWAAFFFLPIAIFANMKVGGEINTIASPLYFAALFLLSHAAHTMNISLDAEGASGVFSRAMVHIMAAVLILVAAPKMVRQAYLNCRMEHPAQTVARVIREHPGEYYFPHYPLEHLLLENRAYHSYWGLWDRWKAHMPVSRRQLREGFPEKLKYIAWPLPCDVPWELSEWVPLVRVEDKGLRLRGFTLYEAPNLATDARKTPD